MANPQNLKPIQKGELSKDEAMRRGSIGGKKSGETRKRKATFKKLFESMLYIEDAEGLTNAEKIAMEVIKSATNGDLKAFVTIRETIGESPTAKSEVTCKGISLAQNTTPEYNLAKIRELKAMLEADSN